MDTGEDVLCPGGHGTATGYGRKGAKGLIGKPDFIFEEQAGAYPAGRMLARKARSVDRDGKSSVAYEASKSDCAIGPLRERARRLRPEA